MTTTNVLKIRCSCFNSHIKYNAGIRMNMIYNAMFRILTILINLLYILYIFFRGIVMNNYPFAFDEIFDIDLTGKFVVTGLFTSMRRSDVVHYIYSHGGTVLSAPTRATDYLIVGGEKSKTWKYGQYGTKIRKGLDLREKDEKILIISEEDFMRCIGENISN